LNDDWKKFANCKGMDVNLFFDDYEDSSETQLLVDKTCGDCVVRKQCLEWALENKLEGGVFGRKYLVQSPKGKKRRKELV
jgi:hypothetical protein